LKLYMLSIMTQYRADSASIISAVNGAAVCDAPASKGDSHE
jgi:hypothetical protein